MFSERGKTDHLTMLVRVWGGSSSVQSLGGVLLLLISSNVRSSVDSTSVTFLSEPKVGALFDLTGPIWTSRGEVAYVQIMCGGCVGRATMSTGCDRINLWLKVHNKQVVEAAGRNQNIA